MTASSGRRVVVVRTGSANLASVRAALLRAGAEVEFSDRPDAVRSARSVVLPGVGAFAAAMVSLAERGLVAPLRERVRDGRPTMGICLGMQLFFEASEESPGVDGLSIVSGTATRFGAAVRVPQLGWNQVVPGPGCKLLTEGWAYYANSYRVGHVTEPWHAALTDYDGPFVAAIERGPVLACQFHPELSGRWGAALIERWLAAGEEASC